MHRDPKVWEELDKFKPERFKGEREGFKFFPFGIGRRACPGANMGVRAISLALGSLIQCFELQEVLQHAKPLNQIPLVGPLFTPPVNVNLVARVVVRAATDLHSHANVNNTTGYDFLVWKVYDNFSEILERVRFTMRQLVQRSGKIQGKVDIFIAGIGTGGTISEVGRFLKQQNPSIKISSDEVVETTKQLALQEGLLANSMLKTGCLKENYGSIEDYGSIHIVNLS
ncbi:hypothetical protein TEA_000519 [Camellia sinensis var. sinensis]|uniref:Uncharacterized protein n=1 Tax=Camellia sinensis var. sinensis TaxID=542762 RepID=A0A4S4D1Q7_CAMSN|nr:hypothetical protein TEA_000519 [Camellia sinensis var. sinensis]